MALKPAVFNTVKCKSESVNVVSSLSLCICYPPPMESGGGYSFGVVSPSFRPSIRPSEFCFRSSSLQLLAGIQRNFMGIINIKKNAHIVGLFRSDPLTQSYGP
jgi:hypothetical protein